MLKTLIDKQKATDEELDRRLKREHYAMRKKHLQEETLRAQVLMTAREALLQEKSLRFLDAQAAAASIARAEESAAATARVAAGVATGRGRAGWRHHQGQGERSLHAEEDHAAVGGARGGKERARGVGGAGKPVLREARRRNRWTSVGSAWIVEGMT